MRARVFSLKMRAYDKVVCAEMIHLKSASVVNQSRVEVAHQYQRLEDHGRTSFKGNKVITMVLHTDLKEGKQDLRLEFSDHTNRYTRITHDWRYDPDVSTADSPDSSDEIPAWANVRRIVRSRREYTVHLAHECGDVLFLASIRFDKKLFKKG